MSTVYVYLTGVDILHQDLECLRVQSLQGDPAAVPLSEPGEHGIEVGGASCQHHLMCRDLKILRH